MKLRNLVLGIAMTLGSLQFAYGLTCYKLEKNIAKSNNVLCWEEPGFDGAQYEILLGEYNERYQSVNAKIEGYLEVEKTNYKDSTLSGKIQPDIYHMTEDPVNLEISKEADNKYKIQIGTKAYTAGAPFAASKEMRGGAIGMGGDSSSDEEQTFSKIANSEEVQ